MASEHVGNYWLCPLSHSRPYGPSQIKKLETGRNKLKHYEQVLDVPVDEMVGSVSSDDQFKVTSTAMTHLTSSLQFFQAGMGND